MKFKIESYKLKTTSSNLLRDIFLRLFIFLLEKSGLQTETSAKLVSTFHFPGWTCNKQNAKQARLAFSRRILSLRFRIVRYIGRSIRRVSIYSHAYLRKVRIKSLRIRRTTGWKPDSWWQVVNCSGNGSGSCSGFGLALQILQAQRKAIRVCLVYVRGEPQIVRINFLVVG